MADENDLPEDMVRDHWHRVCAWVRRRDRHRPWAARLDDNAIAGEVFEEALRIWRKAGAGERPPRDKWVPWLSTITSYKVFEAVRARDRQERAVRGLQSNPIAPPHVGDPADDVASREFLNHVYQCISDLGEPDKSLLLLVWSGRSAAEAAGELGLTRAGAGMRLTRIRRFLKDEGGFAAPSNALRALRGAIERGSHD